MINVVIQMASKLKAILYTILVLVILTFIGFLGYYYGFLTFIYKVMMPEAFSKFNIILLSIIFGIAAFFSPCSFTVMPAYISHHLQGPDEYKGLKALRLGLLAALGVILVTIIIGLIIALLGAAAPFAKDPRQDIPAILAVRAVAGLIIAFLGVLTLTGKSFNLPFIQNFISKTGFSKSMFWYGVFYNGAAIGCTGPILLGLILYALTSGSFASALLAFIVFALTMGLLMVLLTLIISKFKTLVAQKLVGALPVIKYIAAIVMIIVGLGIFILTLEGNKIFVDIFFPFLK